MLTLNNPQTPAEDNLIAFSETVFINALELLPVGDRYNYEAIALDVLLVNRLTGDELMINLLTPATDFATVIDIIKLHFPSRRWGVVESWMVEEREVTESTSTWYQISAHYCSESEGWKVSATSADEDFECLEVFATSDEAIAAGDELWRYEQAYATMLGVFEEWKEKGLITRDEELLIQDNSYPFA